MKKIVLLAVLLFGDFVFANNVEKFEASYTYTMGDNDTKLDARKNALEQAKRIALEKAGSFLDSSSIVEDGMLSSEIIQSFSSSSMKTNIIKEEYTFNGNSPIFEIVIEATVDMDMLKDSIEKARNKPHVKNSNSSPNQDANNNRIDKGGAELSDSGGVKLHF